MHLKENVLKSLAKCFLKSLELTVEAPATDSAIQKKIVGSEVRPLDLAKQTTLIISNEEMDDIIEIVKSLEDSNLLITGVSEIIKYEAKEKKFGS